MRDATQLETDEAAERVTAAITRRPVRLHRVDESLFAPPLPKTPDEGQTSAPRTSPLSVRAGLAAPGIAVENKMSKDRTRDRTSFQELAKLATTPPPPTSVVPSAPTSSGQSGVLRAKEAESSDSGIVDLKMIAQLDPAAEQRAQSTPLAVRWSVRRRVGASEARGDGRSRRESDGLRAVLCCGRCDCSRAGIEREGRARSERGEEGRRRRGPRLRRDHRGRCDRSRWFLLHQVPARAPRGRDAIRARSGHREGGRRQTRGTTAQTTGTPAASVAQNDTQVPDVTDPNAGGTSKSMPKFHVKPGAGAVVEDERRKTTRRHRPAPSIRSSSRTSRRAARAAAAATSPRR